LDLFFTGDTPNALFHNNGNGTFTRVSVGSLVNDIPVGGADSYNGLWFDYDNNGFLDVYVSNGTDDGLSRSANFLYRNNGNGNSWLRLRLIGTVSNRDGVGARVRIRARIRGQWVWQRRDVSGGDVANGNHLYAHFGLGDATRADVIRIEWPSGIVQELKNIPARQILTVTEPPALEALGEGRIRILCWSRQNYEVEASDDLQTWTSLGVVATDLNRPVVLDPGAAGKPHRFYRAKAQ
jgi:hypothetical protein